MACDTFVKIAKYVIVWIFQSDVRCIKANMQTSTVCALCVFSFLACLSRKCKKQFVIEQDPPPSAAPGAPKEPPFMLVIDNHCGVCHLLLPLF